MYMTDRLTLDAPRFDGAGNMVASVLAARTGIQDYAGYEVGKPDQRIVRVFRPESEVFSADSLRSFAGSPVTMNHPPESVTTDNWKQYAVGQTDNEVVRDGEAVRVPFMLRDAGAIRQVEGGKREISMGYACDLAFESGEHNGQAYDAVQRNIRINHLAIVDQARGGPTLRIGDSEMTTKTITFDGLPLVTTDAGEAAINKLLGQLTDANGKVTGLETQVATLTTDKATLEAEKVTLTQQVADAKLTPAQLRDAAKAYSIVVDKAKALGVTVGDADSTDVIMKAAVTAKLGDAAKDWTDAQIAASFASLTADSRVQTTSALDSAIRFSPAVVTDNAAMRDLARSAQY